MLMAPARQFDIFRTEINAHTYARLDRDQKITHTATNLQYPRSRRDEKAIVVPQQSIIESFLLGRSARGALIVKSLAIQHRTGGLFANSLCR